MGDKITYEERTGAGACTMYYAYDSGGKLFGLFYNGGFYFYKRNIQGDIIGIVNSGGTEVVTYTYDTWGKLLSIDTETGYETLGADNPFRYRGYYWDDETGLYYLNQRYYNPEWGRFINADDYMGQTGGLLSHNVFAYCQNNPVMKSDPSGYEDVYHEYMQQYWENRINRKIYKILKATNYGKDLKAFEDYKFTRTKIAPGIYQTDIICETDDSGALNVQWFTIMEGGYDAVYDYAKSQNSSFSWKMWAGVMIIGVVGLAPEMGIPCLISGGSLGAGALIIGGPCDNVLNYLHDSPNEGYYYFFGPEENYWSYGPGLVGGSYTDLLGNTFSWVD